MERPYFDGYIFVKFDVARDRWQAIRSTLGVRHLVCARRDAELPSPVPADDMVRLLQRCAGGPIREADAEMLRLGVEMEVIAGPLASATEPLRGPLTWSNGDRVRLALRLLGGSREVEFYVGSVAVAA